MSDYQVTRDAAGRITTQYGQMLRNLQDDYEDAIVAVSLMNYYNMCSKPDKDEGGQEIDVDEDLLWAIERVLQDYMITDDFNAWLLTKKGV